MPPKNRRRPCGENKKKGNFNMGFFEKLFGRKKKNDYDSKPAIYGGEGTSIGDLAIVNCASPQMAYAIIDNFISKRHGKKEEDWNEGMRLIKSDCSGESNIREIIVELKDGNKISYFFDVSRSMKVAAMMAKMMMSKKA